MSASPPLLEIRDLNAYLSPTGDAGRVLRDVSFAVRPGERVGVVGESGCGKTITGLAILGLIPHAFRRVTGEICFQGENLLALSPQALRRYRGREIGMVFQEPMTSLDPVFTIGEQIAETVRTHFHLSRTAARVQAIAALDRVGIPAARQRYHDYPYQLSGGMRQRVMIAIALICQPRLLIADEPTTALDVTVQAQITALLIELSQQSGTALLMITHDIGVVAETCDRIVTMYAGQVVEDAQTDEMLLRPQHPYTSGLLRSLPRLTPRKVRLPSVPGRVPSAFDMPPGCRFAPRCAYVRTECHGPQTAHVTAAESRVLCCRQEELTLAGVAS